MRVGVRNDVRAVRAKLCNNVKQSAPGAGCCAEASQRAHGRLGLVLSRLGGYVQHGMRLQKGDSIADPEIDLETGADGYGFKHCGAAIGTVGPCLCRDRQQCCNTLCGHAAPPVGPDAAPASDQCALGS